MVRWSARFAGWVLGLGWLAASIGNAAAESATGFGEWQKLTSRSPVLPDASDPAISLMLHGNFVLNSAEPMLVVDVSQHPLPMCSADTDSGVDIAPLGDGTVNGHTQAFGYRCMGGQMTIVAWPVQQPASYWKEQIMTQQPLSLSIAGVNFQSANINGKRAMSVVNRIFME